MSNLIDDLGRIDRLLDEAARTLDPRARSRLIAEAARLQVRAERAAAMTPREASAGARPGRRAG
jgi:hypothetical protein